MLGFMRKLPGKSSFPGCIPGADGIDGHYWEHMTDWFEKDSKTVLLLKMPH
jgi:hypothetical protein